MVDVLQDGYLYHGRVLRPSAVRVAVHLGAVDRDTVQVLDGLAAGDRVVTVGHGGLRPGARIRPVTL